MSFPIRLPSPVGGLAGRTTDERWSGCWRYGPPDPTAAGSIAALAARAQTRQSVKAATDDLDFLRLAVLDALLLLHADGEPVPLPSCRDDRAQVDEDDLNAASTI